MVIVITGPTGVGKTKLSIELAKKMNGEIINADSTQIFKGLDITSDIFDSNDIATNILEQFTEIVSAMENEDYILVADMLNYEVKPLLEELIKSIKETI